MASPSRPRWRCAWREPCRPGHALLPAARRSRLPGAARQPRGSRGPRPAPSASTPLPSSWSRRTRRASPPCDIAPASSEDFPARSAITFSSKSLRIPFSLHHARSTILLMRRPGQVTEIDQAARPVHRQGGRGRQCALLRTGKRRHGPRQPPVGAETVQRAGGQQHEAAVGPDRHRRGSQHDRRVGQGKHDVQGGAFGGENSHSPQLRVVDPDGAVRARRVGSGPRGGIRKQRELLAPPARALPCMPCGLSRPRGARCRPAVPSNRR